MRMLDLTAGLEEDEQNLLMIYNQLSEAGKARATEMLEILLYAQKYLSDDPKFKDFLNEDLTPKDSSK